MSGPEFGLTSSNYQWLYYEVHRSISVTQLATMIVLVRNLDWLISYGCLYTNVVHAFDIDTR